MCARTSLNESKKRPPYVGEHQPAAMDLKGAMWMQRSLGESVSLVHLMENGDVFAGGWDGRLIRWDEEGTTLWSTQTNDRISALAINGDLVVITSGLHLVALSLDSGKELWSVALEGSADDVHWWNGQIIAVSSVYDIEHNDFIESAIWLFSAQGEQQWVERMDERPWTLVESDGHLLAGLGRPRCGWLDISNTPPFSHTKPPTSFPITCGVSGREHLLFGQTDGSVVMQSGDVLATESGSVEALTCLPTGFAASTDEGHLTVRTAQGGLLWESKGEAISAHCEAFENNDSTHLWVARIQGLSGALSVFSSDTGALVATGHFDRIRCIQGTPNRCVIGCENGDVLVWDRELFMRRLDQDEPQHEEPIDERKSALQAKLRALRQ